MMMRTPIALTLSLTLAMSPLLTLANDQPSPLTSGLQTLTNAANGLGSVVGAVGFSQNQMQGLVNQFAGLQAQTTAAGQSLGQFDQVKQQLSTAIAQGQACMTEADTKAKAQAGKFKKATITPANIANTEVTCGNYGAVMDSARKNSYDMAAAKTKIACLQSMQNNIGQIAQSSKQIFSQLTQAATKVWNTRESIINTHKGIAERIDKDLNGENGYRAQLGKLKELSAQVNGAIGAGAGNQRNSPGGFDAQIRALKRERVNAANRWYYDLMTQVHSCFSSDGTQTCDTGTAASPVECIRGRVAFTAGGPLEKNQARMNSARLEQTLRLNQGVLTKTDKMSNVDVSNPEAFLAHANKRFAEKMVAVSNNFNRTAFSGEIQASQIAGFVKSKYESCYRNAVADFNAQMTSKQGSYAAAVTNVEEREAALKSEVTTLLDAAQQQMNDFRTAFTRVYNNDLSTFASVCTERSSVYQSLDCLKMVAVNLKSGIEGSPQSMQLDNGQTHRANPQDTPMNLQTLALDASGNPTLQNKTTTCRGFNACINSLQEYHRYQKEQEDKQTQERKAFVDQHNETIKTAMTGLTAQFSEVSKMLTEQIRQVNAELAPMGVTGALTTKQVEGQELKTSEKTGLFDVPTDMKAAFAGAGSFSEMESPQEVFSAIQTRFAEVSKKVAEAAKKKSECRVKKEDFSQIAEALSCDADKVCSAGNISGLIDPMEGLFNKTSADPQRKANSRIDDSYNSCVRSAQTRSESNRERLDDLEAQKAALYDPEGDSEAAKRKRAENVAARAKIEARIRTMSRRVENGSDDAAKECNIRMVNQLSRESKEGRGDYKATNAGILNAFRQMVNACPASGASEEEASSAREAAASACNRLKGALGKGTGNEKENETVVDTTGQAPVGSTFTNPLSGGAASGR